MEELKSYLKKIEDILEEDKRYKFEAYTFLLSALHDTISKFKKPRHISAEELLEGIRIFALQQFGPMTKTVLNYWGIFETRDFGNIVFLLIEKELLRRQDDDAPEQFDGVYEFDDVFVKGYKIPELEA